MNIKTLHLLSGSIIALFTGFHLFNHLYSIAGIDQHMEIMHTFRVVYRNIFVETTLFLAILVQLFSGFQLLPRFRNHAASAFEKLHVWTGLYLAFFLLIHVGAVLAGRWIFGLDTNFYFGVAGIHLFPYNLFFIPYYFLAVFSFFGHMAAVHNKRMKRTFFSTRPVLQSVVILVIGTCVSLLILYGLTNRFRGMDIPAQYRMLFKN